MEDATFALMACIYIDNQQYTHWFSFVLGFEALRGTTQETQKLNCQNEQSAYLMCDSPPFWTSPTFTRCTPPMSVYGYICVVRHARNVY